MIICYFRPQTKVKNFQKVNLLKLSSLPSFKIFGRRRADNIFGEALPFPYVYSDKRNGKVELLPVSNISVTRQKTLFQRIPVHLFV